MRIPKRSRMETINYFKPNETKYQDWFRDRYLKPLGLINKRINNDFEGIICNNNKEIALFEIKLVTLLNKQKEINEELEKNKNSEYLHTLPKQKEIRRALRDIIMKASSQVLSKQPQKRLPRIIYFIKNTPDFNKEDIIDAIKSKRQVVCGEKGKVSFMYGCERNDNKGVLDLFNNNDLSGLICLTLNPEPSGYIIEVIKNNNANNPLPDIFLHEHNIKIIGI